MIRRLASVALWCVLAACSPAPDPDFSEIVSGNVRDEHRFFEVGAIRSATSCLASGRRQAPTFEALRLTLRVDGRGDVEVRRVTSADGNLAVTPECERRAREIAARWRYAPFVSVRGPTVVEFDEVIPIYPEERWREPRVAFPDQFDLATARVELQRTACLGSCPSYKVELRGDGTFRYEGWGFVEVEGVREGAINLAAFAALIDEFRAADFYSLYPAYEAGITDHPIYMLTLELNGRTHTVTDYVGQEVGMPSAVTALEQSVDAIAETERLVGRRRF